MRSQNFSTTSTITFHARRGGSSCVAGRERRPSRNPTRNSRRSSKENYPQQTPTYAQPPPAPAYGRQNASGTVSGFDGQWVVYMHDDKGYTDHVTLHQGTIINPTGIKLLEGMRVTIYGNADGPTFQANRVDVAYSPYSPYYGSDGNPAYGYGDGGYGYGWLRLWRLGYGYPSGGYGYGTAPLRLEPRH